MKSKIFIFSNSIMIAILLSSFYSYGQDPGWTNLLDKDLSQWRMYLGYRIPPGYKGEIPRDEKGDQQKPLGYDKNENNVFSVTEENGEPVLRISGEIYGCIFTKKVYENYDLKLKVKWGTAKWDPRKDKLKDSGVLYNSTGDCGIDYWKAWMLSQEFQVMEGHMGDYWSMASSAIDIRAYLPEGVMNPLASSGQPFLPLGSGTGNGGFCMHSGDYESQPGQWTELELISFGDKSLHIVNGHVVMVLRNSRYFENGKYLPLDKGKIQLQSEASEVYYKDIKIRNLDSIPDEYAQLFN
jgi:hypothetical protein